MRCSSFLLVCTLPLVATAIKLPFSLDWLVPTSAGNLLSSEVVPHRIAIIGAGAGGSSAAFWLSKAKARNGVAVEVDVYEKENYIGGRSTVVYPYNDTSLTPVELGASIFVSVNKNLWRATDEFGLDRIAFSDDDDPLGFWDGEKFVFIMSGATGISGWLDNLKALWRYGYRGPKRTQALVERMINKFLTLYSKETPRWSNISSLNEEMGWEELVAQTTAEYFDGNGVYRLFTREVVEGATRCNYGQDVDQLHALEGACSMAANSASSAKGGNFQIYQNFLARSGAQVFLNTTVTSIEESHSKWAIKTSESTEVKLYDDVIVAAPFHSTGIQLSSSKSQIAEIPPQPYVHLHVTLLTTTAPYADPVYFGLKPGANVPTTIFTTYEGVRNGGPEPEFNSLSFHGPISEGSEEQVVKIFSKQRVEDDWLNKVFGGKVGWILRKEWNAYPKLPPTTDFPPVVLAPGLYYVNAFEPFISTMETETISSRNIVDLIFHKRFGAGLCGKQVSEISEGQQTILGSKSEFTSKTATEFVYGWDC